MTTPALATDARNRAARSFYQGFGIDIAVAVAMALLAWLPDADVSKKEAWLILGTSLVKTVLQAGAAYVMRLKLDGSSVPTPLPPADPGEPDAVHPNEGGYGAVELLVVVILVVVLLVVLFRLV